ncbi:MAG: response regulator transcription factor [Thermodesulfobacteriota bacterium]
MFRLFSIRERLELQPEVILMDISMPGMDGVEATEIIHAAHPAIRIIGLSMHDQHAHAELMQIAGAVAYCAKTGDTATLIAAIRSR